MRLLNEKIERFLWSAKLAERPWWIRFLVRFSRQVFALFRDLIGGQLTLRAMSLVYTTLLSVVPLLAFSFSMFKAFKIDDNNLKDKLTELTAPLGDAGADVTEKVLNVVDNVQGSLLGTLSLAFFIYTAIAMVQKVESSFNYIWRVDKPRALARRVTEYLSILLIGPIVMAIALSMIASISNDTLVARIAAVEPFGSAMLLAGKVLPYIIVISVFTFLYKYLPNARVRFRSALIGGITAGVLWAFAGVVFANFVANSAQTNAIYATFAVAISTLIWLYLSWLILLIGAQVAFYTQHPIFLRLGRQDPRLSNGLREKIALNAMFLVGQAFRDESLKVSANDLARQMNIPGLTIGPILSDLENAGLLARNDEDQLLPGREMARIKILDILAAIREGGETGSLLPPMWSEPVQSLADSLNASMARIVNDQSLSEFLDQADAQSAKDAQTVD